VTYRQGDLRDDAFVRELFASSHIRSVVHLATVTASGPRELDCAAAMIEINVLCVERVLKAAAAHGSPRVVYVGSGSAYGKAWHSAIPLREEESASRPDTLYGITKLAGEGVALRLGELHGLDVRAVRLGSVFGPWERETGAREAMSIFLQIARLALRGEHAVLPRRLFARDWIYSRDVAAGLVALAQASAPKHRLYHLTSGLDWSNGVVQWCRTLAAAVDGFDFRVAEGDEQPNVFDSAARDRAPMCVERLETDIRFSPRYGPEPAGRDFAQWLVEHGRFVLNDDDSAAGPATTVPPA
jgi:nucleoside-diphosphate-sugar epimerase